MRASRPVLREAGGETPPAYSPDRAGPGQGQDGHWSGTASEAILSRFRRRRRVELFSDAGFADFADFDDIIAEIFGRRDDIGFRRRGPEVR